MLAIQPMLKISRFSSFLCLPLLASAALAACNSGDGTDSPPGIGGGSTSGGSSSIGGGDPGAGGVTTSGGGSNLGGAGGSGVGGGFPAIEALPISPTLVI